MDISSKDKLIDAYLSANSIDRFIQLEISTSNQEILNPRLDPEITYSQFHDIYRWYLINFDWLKYHTTVRDMRIPKLVIRIGPFSLYYVPGDPGYRVIFEYFNNVR